MRITYNALLFSVCISSFLSSFMGNAINVATPFIAADYGVPPDNITWVINAFMITSAAFLIPATALANFKGYAAIYRAGSILAAITSVIIPLAPNFFTLILLRAFQGIAFALPFCTGMALIVDRTAKEQRASALAFVVSSVYAGISIAPLLSGVISDTVGWEQIFVLGAIGQAIGYVLALKVPSDEPIAHGFPLIRMILCFTAMTISLVTVSSLNINHYALIFICVSIALIVLYLLAEQKANRPVLPLSSVLKNTDFSLALAISMLNFIATFAIAMLLSLHLQIVCGYNATFTGLILMSQPVMMLVGSSLSASWTRRFGVHILTVCGMVLVTIGFVGFTFLKVSTPLYLIAVLLFITGFGTGIFSPPNTNIVMSSVPRTQYALASSLQSLVRTAGMAISMAVMTLILNAMISSDTQIHSYIEELSQGITLMFKVSALMCFITTLLNLYASVTALKRIKANNKQADK